MPHPQFVLRIFIAALAVIAASGAQAAEDVARRLSVCRTIPDFTTRAICYDRVVDDMTILAPSARIAPAAPSSAAPVPAAPVSPAPVAAAPARVPPAAAVPAARTPPPASPPQNTTASFGGENLPQARAQTREADNESLSALVSGARKDPYGDAVLTLDNGQVWKQTDGSPVNLKPGAAVVIKRGFLGSYHMTVADMGRTFKVERVQ